jgi:hypothetical protein
MNGHHSDVTVSPSLADYCRIQTRWPERFSISRWPLAWSSGPCRWFQLPRLSWRYISLFVRSWATVKLLSSGHAAMHMRMDHEADGELLIQV